MNRVYIHERDERDEIDGCPSCGHWECELCDSGYDGKEHWAAYECGLCGQEFTEIYTYKYTDYTREVRR